METKINNNNSANIDSFGVVISYLETFIDQTSTTHLNIFLVIVGVLILLISIFILILCNKLLSNTNSYRSTQTRVSN